MIRYGLKSLDHRSPSLPGPIIDWPYPRQPQARPNHWLLLPLAILVIGRIAQALFGG
jgi:hypothetical protein